MHWDVWKATDQKLQLRWWHQLKDWERYHCCQTLPHCQCNLEIIYNKLAIFLAYIVSLGSLNKPRKATKLRNLILHSITYNLNLPTSIKNCQSRYKIMPNP